MQFSTAFIAAVLAATAYSQSVADLVAEIPTCAVTCLATAATGAGCGISDYECQCADIKTITTSATPCVLSGCKGDDPIKTLQTTTKICDVIAKGSGEDSPSPTKPEDGAEASVQPSVQPSVAPETPEESPEATAPAAPVFTGAAGQLQAGSAIAAIAALAAFAL